MLGALRARDALHGRRVRWASGEGVACGIDDAGRLLVKPARAVEPVALDAGEVHLLPDLNASALAAHHGLAVVDVAAAGGEHGLQDDALAVLPRRPTGRDRGLHHDASQCCRGGLPAVMVVCTTTPSQWLSFRPPAVTAVCTTTPAAVGAGAADDVRVCMVCLL